MISPRHVNGYGDQGRQGTTVSCPGRPKNILSPIEREKQDCLNSSLVSEEGRSMFEDATASLTGPGLSSPRSSPIDPHLGNTVRTQRLSSGSTSKTLIVREIKSILNLWHFCLFSCFKEIFPWREYFSLVRLMLVSISLEMFLSKVLSF